MAPTNIEPWAPSPAEAQLLAMDVVEWELCPGRYHNRCWIVRSIEGTRAVFKPADGERESGRTFAPGTFWRREIATYRMAAVIRCGLVAVTVERTLRGRSGSLQMFVADEGFHPDSYGDVDRQMIGVLDYLLGQTDRGDTEPEGRGWRTSPDGRPALIDNGLSFPRSNADTLTTAWLGFAFDVELDDSVTEALQNLGIERIRGVLHQIGVEEDAADGVISRLREVQEGRITGQAWSGPIVPPPPGYDLTAS